MSKLLRRWYLAHQQLKQALDVIVCRESPRSDGRCLRIYFNNYPANFEDDPVVQFMQEPSYGATPEQLRARPHMRMLTPAQSTLLALIRDESRAYLERVRYYYEHHYQDDRDLARSLQQTEKLLGEIDQFFAAQ